MVYPIFGEFLCFYLYQVLFDELEFVGPIIIPFLQKLRTLFAFYGVDSSLFAMNLFNLLLFLLLGANNDIFLAVYGEHVQIAPLTISHPWSRSMNKGVLAVFPNIIRLMGYICKIMELTFNSLHFVFTNFRNLVFVIFIMVFTFFEIRHLIFDNNKRWLLLNTNFRRALFWRKSQKYSLLESGTLRLIIRYFDFLARFKLFLRNIPSSLLSLIWLFVVHAYINLKVYGLLRIISDIN